MSYRFRDLVLETLEDLVYVPAEDSELLAENMGEPRGRVLDVGCGCGIQSLVAAKTAECVLGVDVNPDAVELSRRNASANRVENAEFLLSDMFANVKGRFDLVLFNPPYLPVEEDGMLEKAWAGGRDGVREINRFIDGVSDRLLPGGRALLLVSDANRPDEVLRRFASSGFDARVIAKKRLFFEGLCIVSAAFKG
jgi:release factor glutamine methyltransferase